WGRWGGSSAWPRLSTPRSRRSSRLSPPSPIRRSPPRSVGTPCRCTLLSGSRPGEYRLELGKGRLVQLDVAREGIRTDVIGVAAPGDRRGHPRLRHVPRESELGA